MNRLVIIGNGFDLAHGYKTSYSDFLLWYLKKAIDESALEKEYVDDMLSIMNFTRVTMPRDLQSTDEIFKIIDEIPNLNITWKSTFVKKLFALSKESNWIDIERNYFIEIRRIANQYNDSKTNNDKLKIQLILLNKQMECLRKKLFDYLKTLKIQANVNMIDKIGEILFEISKPEEFKSILDGYNAEDPKRKIHFLNFNYTNTIYRYTDNVSYAKKIDGINSIHGTLLDLDSIVFGFGDEMDHVYDEIENLNENEFFKFVKSFFYLKAENYRNLQRFIDSKKFQVYVMGHSCGLSDRTMLNSIFEHENCCSIKLFYHDQGGGKNDFTEKTHEISRHFKNKAVMRNRIVPFENSEPLPNYKPEQES